MVPEAGKAGGMSDPARENGQKYARWLHELDAWTEYWDIYHPETRGRYYFGDGRGEEGLLTCFLPREQRPASFLAWKQLALTGDDGGSFAKEILVPKVS